jgi:hypothetical protein
VAVGVGLDLPDDRSVPDGPDGGRGKLPMRLGPGRDEPELEIDGGRDAGLPDRAGHPVGIVQAGGERLLAEQVLAGPSG